MNFKQRCLRSQNLITRDPGKNHTNMLLPSFSQENLQQLHQK
uniref:Uncharacterized protein n=1 Tax=Rhizophora mucronata TaxID=61149 RepID=A0A2P2R5H2_RHIMU